MASHADCRMYESKYPDVDDVVMVQVKSIAEMGAYVSLLEYNGIEGMILLSELSRRRIRSITKLIKVQHGLLACKTLKCTVKSAPYKPLLLAEGDLQTRSTNMLLRFWQVTILNSISAILGRSCRH